MVPFQMYSSFKFYLSNEASNELLPETKVVDLEILNNFGIQKFFIGGHVEGEKLSLPTRVLHFALITKLPHHHLPSLFHVHGIAVSPPARPRAAPSPLPRPWFL